MLYQHKWSESNLKLSSSIQMLPKGKGHIVFGILQIIIKQKSWSFKNLTQMEKKNDRSLHTI